MSAITFVKRKKNSKIGFSHSINCNLAVLKKNHNLRFLKSSTGPSFTLHLFLIFKFLQFFHFICVLVFCVLFTCGKHPFNTFLCAT